MLTLLAKTGIWPFPWLYSKFHTRRITLPPSSPPIVPSFVTASELVDGEHFYNPDFYASEQTAMEIMKRFNALVAFKKVIKDGERYAPAQWFVRFAGDTMSEEIEVNAGQLAKFFACYPEGDYPGIAARFGLSLIAHERGMKEAMRQQEINQ